MILLLLVIWVVIALCSLCNRAFGGLALTGMCDSMCSCDFCQRNKPSNDRPAGLLQPLPVPEFRWQWVTVDFIQDLPETKAGHTAIVVFVDRLSKMVHFAPAWNNMGAEEFAQILVTNVFRLHGMPMFLVSDRDKLLTSRFFEKVSELLGIGQKMSTALHPKLMGRLSVPIEHWKIC